MNQTTDNQVECFSKKYLEISAHDMQIFKRIFPAGEVYLNADSWQELYHSGFNVRIFLRMLKPEILAEHVAFSKKRYTANKGPLASTMLYKVKFDIAWNIYKLITQRQNVVFSVISNRQIPD